MSERRQVWATLAGLLQRLEGAQTADREAISSELRKLGKTQFKTNALAESHLAQSQTALASLENAQAQQADLLKLLREERQAQANQQLLVAILPTLDGLEQAMTSGQSYLGQRDKAAKLANLTPAQAQLVSPADRAMLAGWLGGLRLVHERLLAVLAAGGVTRIPTVERPFDPFLHKAVGTVATVEAVDMTPNTIVREERPGYQTETGVLRFAEVIVYKPPR